MESIPNKREFSMKYCPNLEDDVVVMTAEGASIPNKICLSSHLCHTDTRMSCGHERPQSDKKEATNVS